MEELLACALLLCEGFELEREYRELLDELFRNDPENEELLELEFRSGNIKDSCLYLKARFYALELDRERFGRALTGRLAGFYRQSELRQFAEAVYRVWLNLPKDIAGQQPFWALCYADDPLSWGDEKQCRELYEAALGYYNNKEK